jgi:hypothetical protein
MQAATTCLPQESLRDKPALEVKRILMVDFATTQARGKGADPSDNHEGG